MHLCYSTGLDLFLTREEVSPDCDMFIRSVQIMTRCRYVAGPNLRKISLVAVQGVKIFPLKLLLGYCVEARQ